MNATSPPSKSIILASSSRYRQQLLQRLNISFTACAPDIDEQPEQGEIASQLAYRLATAKAYALSPLHPEALIIGSDQVAALDDQILTKPLDKTTAFSQLQHCQGRQVTFFTGLCVLDSKLQQHKTVVEPVVVKFRELTDQEIQDYIEQEQPLDCAGSFKCEGLGIALFEYINSQDPNTLIGLPLIQLVSLLKEFGVNPLLLQK
ncbi:Maf family protein [Zooshikella ganghwensis]|uniref:Maf family protein n=1 Tax=Zooshikella ganghwensis TaxID=202772 RepID=UPI0003FB0EBF|nr:Maf family protein [Zooshikella ganghwensis]